MKIKWREVYIHVAVCYLSFNFSFICMAVVHFFDRKTLLPACIGILAIYPAYKFFRWLFLEREGVIKITNRVVDFLEGVKF